MKILIIGGTKFVGRHLAASLVRDSHEVALFHRGQTGAEVFPDLRRILGDRETDLGRASQEEWDWVIDTCAYIPRMARIAAEALRPVTRRYLFISTISVYSADQAPNIAENGAMLTLEDPNVETVTPESYGGLKVLCESVFNESFGEDVLHIRPGILVGPYDPTDRFTYWVTKIATGDRFAAPTYPEQPIQLLDARDLANFCAEQIARDARGAFNVVGPDAPVSLESMMQSISLGLGQHAQPVWTPKETLESHGIHLPLDASHPSPTLFQVNAAHAKAAGLDPRTLDESARDTLAWYRESGSPALRTAVDPKIESEILNSPNG